MNTGYVYCGEMGGSRIFRYNNSAYFQQARATDLGFIFDYEFEAGAWGEQPFGNDGEGIFRWMTVVIKHLHGYNIQVVPNVDDVDLPPSNFAGGAPPNGKPEQIVRCRVWMETRGNRLSFTVRSLSLPGYLELLDVVYQPVAIRMGP